MNNPRFTPLEATVSIIVFAILVAVAQPLSSAAKANSGRIALLTKMKDLGRALNSYTTNNGGALPAKDAPGGDTWENAAKPDANDAWYNALPRSIGRKGVGDFTSTPRDFYGEENLLYFELATYPDWSERVRRPYFPVAYNANLLSGNASGQTKKITLANIVNPAATVAFFERGLPNEPRGHQAQTEKDFDGSGNGTAKSFVGRHDGKGILLFIDGHIEDASVRDLLTEKGEMPFPPAHFIWASFPEIDPNVVRK
jgi:prepilin-type processing-associated H-X9-DG protein